MSKFSAILSILIPKVISEITLHYSISEIMATEKFYSSKTYSLLEQEDTGLWHYSPLTLFNIFKDEQLTGELLLPEEV